MRMRNVLNTEDFKMEFMKSYAAGVWESDLFNVVLTVNVLPDGSYRIAREADYNYVPGKYTVCSEHISLNPDIMSQFRNEHERQADDRHVFVQWYCQHYSDQLNVLLDRVLQESEEKVQAILNGEQKQEERNENQEIRLRSLAQLILTASDSDKPQAVHLDGFVMPSYLHQLFYTSPESFAEQDFMHLSTEMQMEFLTDHLRKMVSF